MGLHQALCIYVIAVSLLVLLDAHQWEQMCLWAGVAFSWDSTYCVVQSWYKGFHLVLLYLVLLCWFLSIVGILFSTVKQRWGWIWDRRDGKRSWEGWMEGKLWLDCIVWEKNLLWIKKNKIKVKIWRQCRKFLLYGFPEVQNFGFSGPLGFPNTQKVLSAFEAPHIFLNGTFGILLGCLGICSAWFKKEQLVGRPLYVLCFYHHIIAFLLTLIFLPFLELFLGIRYTWDLAWGK